MQKHITLTDISGYYSEWYLKSTADALHEEVLEDLSKATFTDLVVANTYPLGLYKLLMNISYIHNVKDGDSYLQRVKEMLKEIPDSEHKKAYYAYSFLLVNIQLYAKMQFSRLYNIIFALSLLYFDHNKVRI